MEKREKNPVVSKVLGELEQSHETRQPIFEKLEEKLERPVVSFFTSFGFPVMIEDVDADMLQDILLAMDLSKGFALVINSPGGDGLAAERIINVCRNCSGTGEYWAIVPGKAKSAATMICLGASKILMSGTSELGPIDPQITVPESSILRFSVYNIIKSYENLFRRAVNTKGNLQPYLQQLHNYDEREIEEFRSALSLSEDIAIKALASGMMKGVGKQAIKKKIKVFLTPEKTKTHGRPIYRDEARKCNLRVEEIDSDLELWELVYQLYIRTNNFVSRKVSKCIESSRHSFVVPAPKGGQNE